MFKFVLFFLLIVFLGACGVDTSSSPAESVPTEEQSGIVLTDLDLVVSNPIDSNQVVDDSGGDDSGGDDSGGDDSGGDDSGGDDSGSTVVNPNDSYFDTIDAIEDPNACSANIYNVASDASYGGELDAENGASSSIIDGQGLVFRSEYLSQDYMSTWVTLFYQTFKSPNDLGLQGVSSYKMEDVFYLSYDNAWADESIPNIDNRVYVQSNKGIKPACYRLDLNSVIGTEIDVQKVYRLKL